METHCGIIPARPMKYLVNLSTGRMILWCYFIWYLVVFVRYFDPSPRLWLTSLGLSFIIGVALFISTTSASATGGIRTKLGGWQVFRLFLMPFCVSSFSALVKGRGFILIFSPQWRENAFAATLCVVFVCFVLRMKSRKGRRPGQP